MLAPENSTRRHKDYPRALVLRLEEKVIVARKRRIGGMRRRQREREREGSSVVYQALLKKIKIDDDRGEFAAGSSAADDERADCSSGRVISLTQLFNRACQSMRCTCSATR